MFERLKAIFTNGTNDELLIDTREDQQVALAAAMLLLEVAWADHEIEARELDLVRTALQSLYGVGDDHVDTVIQDARTQHESSTSILPFTRTLNEELSVEERRKLLDHLWRLNAFDGSEFHFEENVIRKVADLLYLNHSEFITAKLAARKAVS